MRHLIPATLTAAVLLALGVYHGLATDRWSDPNAADHPGQCFANLATEIGDWQSEALPRQVDDDSKTSVLNRRYTNRMSGRWVVTSITSGRSGRVAVHDPEHCYLGSGYKVVDSIREDSLTLPSGTAARFWTAHFEKKKPAGIESIRIYWGWTEDGQWQAPAYPRLFFAGKPRLHKLYMIHGVPPGDGVEDPAPYREFMVQFLTEVNRHLGP